jgi:hypothetical protein
MRRWSLIVLLLLFAAPMWAQGSKDPLTEAEAEQIRDVADQPPERIKLYMKFIEQRTSVISQIARNPSRGATLHTLLDEFTRLADELQDNLDVYSTTHADIRKALKDVVDTSSKWPAILNLPAPDHAYDFSRKTALDAAISTSDQAKSILAEQEVYFSKEKVKERKKAAENSPHVD